MHLPSDLSTWLKLIGALSAGIGSILLAWRVKAILQWVVYCLIAHEESIETLGKLAANQQQTRPIVVGVTSQLIDIQSRLGFVLLIIGLSLLGIGMLSNAASYLF